jgi:SAM-dependent methyltransferase
MTESQTTHPIYELKVDVSNTSRLFEYYMLKDSIKKNDVVLDIGCNTGTGMDILSGFSDHVYGIDVVPELQEILEAKYRENQNIHFKIVKEGEIPFADNFFDVIVANNFIEHVQDPVFYLQMFKKLLKPEGKLYLTTVNRAHRLYSWQKPYNPHHFTEYSAKSLSSVLKTVFDQVSIKGIVKRPPFFPDYVAIAAERKFRLGIKYPVLNFLQRIKSVFVAKKQPVQTETHEPAAQETLKTEKFNIEDFRESFTYISIDEQNKGKWIELFAICEKEKSGTH